MNSPPHSAVAGSPMRSRPYIQSGVLVVDEVGYLTYGTDAANMLFHVVTIAIGRSAR